MTEVKRVFVGGLSPEITQKDLEERFHKFGEVLDVQFKKKQECENNPEKIFAYLNVKSTPENLKKCISLYNKTKWKGSELRLQLAKENFLTRLEIERKNGFRVEEKKKLDKKKDSFEFHNPFENLPEPDTHEMRGCVPGTKVPGEENWVVGKYGRVLPIVYVRNKEKKRIVKVDPSKFCHNLKRMKDDDTTTTLSKQKTLTLSIDEDDSEMVKKRKGEFPEWKPSPSKKKKIDYEKLRELYMNDNRKSRFDTVDREPDFEIVSGDLSVSGVGKTFDSGDSDSDSYYTSLKNTQTKSLSKGGKLIKTVNKNRKSSDIRENGANLSSNYFNSESENHSDMEVTQTCDTEKSLNSKKNLLESETQKGSDATRRTPSSNSVTKPTILNQNSPVKKTKPTMKPFGGTKMLYQNANSENSVEREKCTKSVGSITTIEEISTLSVTEQLNTKSKITPSKNQDNKITNTCMSSNNSTDKKIDLENKSKVKPKSLKMPSNSITMAEPLNSLGSDGDGNDSASSADTDELINNLKCRTPSYTDNDSKQRKTDIKEYDFDKSKYSNRKNSMNYNLNLSSVDEFSSGLVGGEIPVENDFSDGNVGDDSDDSDFEKFALKELQKVNRLKEKEAKSSNNTKDDISSEKDQTVKINNETLLKRKPNKSSLSGSSESTSKSVKCHRKGEVTKDDSSSSSDGNDSDDEESNGTSDGYLKSDSSGCHSDGSLSDDENSDSDSKGLSDDDSDSNSKSLSDDASDSDSKSLSDDDSDSDSKSLSDDDNDSDSKSLSNEDSDSDPKSLSDDDNDSDSKSLSDDNSDSDSTTENLSIRKENVENSKKSTILETSKSAKDTRANNKSTNKEKIQGGGPKQNSDKSETQNKNIDKDRKEDINTNKKRLETGKPKHMENQAQKKQDVDTNKKRLETVKQRQMENQAQKSIIQKALANIDGTEKSNKKIIFDDSDDGEDDKLSLSVQQTSLLSTDSSESESDSVENEGNKQKKVSGLFDNSEEDSSDNDKEMFKIRPEFEGRSGQRRMELQSRYGNDDRFKLDERFIDSDNDEALEEPEKPVEEDEKTKSLKILEEVIGSKIITEKKGKMFRDALHFDPTREDHAQYEVKKDPTKKDKKEAKKKKVAEEGKEEDITEELPEVGKEKFFEVSDSLKDVFKPGSKSDDSQGFSLLSAFSSHGDKDAVSDDDDDDMEMKTLKHKSNTYPWQQQFDDESSDSDRNGEDVDVSSDEGGEKTQKEAVVFTSSKSLFFFQENDDRIKEGIKNFCRQESLEVIREKWLEKRPDLVEAYRTKHKRLLRKVKMDKKHTKKQILHRRR